MKNTLHLFVGGLVMLYTTVNAQWSNVGADFVSASSSSSTNIVSNEFGVFTAFIETNRANVKKFNGVNWETVGSPNFSPQNIQSLSLAMDGATPYVAFRDNSAGSKVSVMRFNGNTWEYVGPQGFSSGAVQYTKIRINNNIPYVAFQNSSNGKASVMAFNGADWQFVGNPAIGQGTVWNLQLEWNDNTPYLSFREFLSGVNKLNVMKLVSGTWQYEGSAVEDLQLNSDGSNPLVNSSIAFEPEIKTPYVSYIINSPDGFQRVLITKKLTGGNWTAVGNPVNNVFNTISGGLKLVFYNNKPTVAFCNYNTSTPDVKISVQNFHEGTWQSLDGNLFASAGVIGSEEFPQDVSLDLFADNNNLYLSYSEDFPINGRLRVRKFTGTLSSIDRVPFTDQVTVYPNPSNGILNISTYQDQEPAWTVYNSLGQLLLQGYTSHVTIASLPQGHYILQIKYADKSFVKHIIRK
ncbi:hypothetical protein CHU92_09415 [Flavobacterium cyanobacteriorum]|uniref:Secretion system C-terminal sorting domain-containing protein n=1 Tax=Flavobacterium cyanobacteriorum TaxID=2022802 RepID=A0A255Z5K8_9FLAO|nr:T9SS type A sorting domain-containing protein [Flavobacterium cyanobacteriorum]OYQ36736.1 hypothetical protein CHU92_09415 [Flavobacterium cyanobacteriorum]